MTDGEAQMLVMVCLAPYMPRITAQGMGPQEVRAMTAAYRDGIRDLDIQAARSAVARLHRTCKFLPSISEIREEALENRRVRRRFGGDGWRDFLHEASRRGAYQTPVFEDPIVGEVVRTLGWQELCLSKNQTADRARFIQLYEQISARHRNRDLAGQEAASNLLHGCTCTHWNKAGQACPVHDKKP